MTVPMDPPIQLIDTHVHFDRLSPEEAEAWFGAPGRRGCTG